MISLGATLVMSVNEFDLSVGSMASLGGVMAALLAVRGLPMAVCFLVPVAISFCVGLLNGWIVARFRVLSFITTLGMSTVLSGVIYRLSGGATVFEGIPKSFSVLGTAKLGGIPLLSILMAAFTALFFFLLIKTGKAFRQCLCFLQYGKHRSDQHNNQKQAHKKTHIALIFFCWNQMHGHGK